MTTPDTFSVVDSRVAFAGKIATVRIDEVVMPGGGTALREVVEHDRAVAVVAVDDDGNVVLIEQYRHPLRRRLWELPAGLMDVHGESPQPAAARELGEETGLAARTWSVLVDVAASPGFTDEVVRVFLATGLIDIGRQGEIGDEEADLKIVRVPLSSRCLRPWPGTSSTPQRSPVCWLRRSRWMSVRLPRCCCARAPASGPMAPASLTSVPACRTHRR